MSDKTLTEHDLEPWEQRALDLAYQERERRQASREDFAAGWISCLISHRSKSAFKAGVFRDDSKGDMVK